MKSAPPPSFNPLRAAVRRRVPVAMITLIITVAAPLLAGPCGPPPPPAVDPREILRLAAVHLERLRQYLEEWGTVTLSEPMAMMEVGQLKLEGAFPDTPAYIARARDGVQGRVAQENDVGVSGRVAANVQPIISSTTAGGATTTTATTAATAPPEPPGTTLAAGTGTDKFTTAGGLIGTGSVTVTERQALTTGVNDKLTELLLRQLAHPSELADKNSIRLFLGIFQVSCNPGWRTRRDYQGDVDVFLEYADPKRDRYSVSGESWRRGKPPVQPRIFSLLPLVDAQTLDTTNSQRQLLALAAQLSGSLPVQGARVDAKGILEAFRRYQGDATTRTATPITNSYSTGTNFGFRFAPSFLALSDPAQRNSGSANVLLPTVFPAAVLVGIRPEDTLGHAYTHFVTHVNSRWTLINRRPFFPKRRETQELRLGLAEDMRALDAYLQQAGELLPPGDPALLAMRRSRMELESKGLGKTQLSPLPPELRVAAKTPRPRKPTITEVRPLRLSEDVETTIVIRGTDLADAEAVFVGGKACRGVRAVNETTVIATVPAGPASGDYAVEAPPGGEPFLRLLPTVVTKAGVARPDPTNPGQLTQTSLTLVRSVFPRVPPEVHEITLHRDQASGRVEKVSFRENGSLSAEKMLEAIRGILAAETPLPAK